VNVGQLQYREPGNVCTVLADVYMSFMKLGMGLPSVQRLTVANLPR